MVASSCLSVDTREAKFSLQSRQSDRGVSMNISLPMDSAACRAFLRLANEVLYPNAVLKVAVGIPVHIVRRENPVPIPLGAKGWAGSFFSIVFLGGITIITIDYVQVEVKGGSFGNITRYGEYS